MILSMDNVNLYTDILLADTSRCHSDGRCHNNEQLKMLQTTQMYSVMIMSFVTLHTRYVAMTMK